MGLSQHGEGGGRNAAAAEHLLLFCSSHFGSGRADNGSVGHMHGDLQTDRHDCMRNLGHCWCAKPQQSVTTLAKDRTRWCD
jgi:hypothetical protein